ncbi:hypothetical protein AB0H92_41165 [Streptomyces phaeochromogenes]|uniref:hypothetical protein n=1 Tax=Streptomyces phaeochromogenes TaxID=1923 RepID=UPI0033D3421F
MHGVRARRSILGLIGALALMLAAVFTAGPAQAAVASGDSAAGLVLTAPPAPQDAQSASTRAVAANSPSVSPSASSVHVAPGGTVSCPSGNLCTVVWDPTTNNWEVFFLYSCNRYYTSYWDGAGSYYDAQTGGVTSYIYGQSGNVLHSFRPDSVLHAYNWTPVWSIRNC